MERHAAWLTALVVVLVVWLGLVCCGPRSRKTARTHRESLPHETTEQANGEVHSEPPNDTATMADVDRAGDGRYLVEEPREQDSMSMEAIVDVHNATEAKSAEVSREEFEPCIRSKSSGEDVVARQHRQHAEEAQEDENGTRSVAINVGRS